jgi:hypothetical protein
MGHGAEQHMEHAEHAQHAAHNPFDRKVTVTIAVVAAMLAAVTTVGHRAHNDNLRLNSEMADQYAYYQAKKNRQVMYEAFVDTVSLLPLKDGLEATKEIVLAKWNLQIKKDKGALPEIQEKAERFKAQAESVHHQANRYDLGELALQLGVVLCSMAILTKGQGFWYTGMVCSLIGFVVALTGYFSWFMGEGGHH